MDAVEVDGLRIAYRRAGAGDPLLLLHGGFEDSRLWMDDIERLQEHVDVIAWDAPGCGASDDVPDGWRAADWSRTAASFIDALGLAHPAVAGFSFGSTLALLLARDHPESVGGLVLVGAYAGWRGSLDADDFARRVEATQFTLTHPVEERVDDFLASVYTPETPPRRRNLSRELVDHWRRDTTRALLDVMMLDLSGALGSIATPTLVARGVDDTRSPREASLEIVERMPHARFVEIPDAGHDASGLALDALLIEAAHAAAAVH